jgi:hypothetical protein
MNLKDILAISGEGTLFKFIAQGKNAVIVENLETGKRFSAGTAAKVSALEEISIYSTGEDIPLSKVMDLIWEKENGGQAISHKQPDADLKKYFAEVLPDYDRDRVYNSDIKKVLHWYNLLQAMNLLVKEEEKAAEQEETGESDKNTGEAGEEEVPSAGESIHKEGDAGKKSAPQARRKAATGSGSKKPEE